MEKEAKDKTGQQPTEEELEEWLQKHQAILDPKEAEKEEKKNEQ